MESIPDARGALDALSAWKRRNPAWRFSRLNGVRINSFRLHAAVDHDLDEHRLARRNRVDVSGSKRVRGFDTMTPDAERLCQRRELDRRIDKIHADKALGAMK